MLNHIIFIGLYILLGEFADPVYMHMLSIVHYAILIIQFASRDKFKISPEILLYLMSIQISAGNIILLETLGTPNQSRSYYYIVPKYITQASILWLVCTEIFFMGYKYFNKVSLPIIRYELNKRSTNNMVRLVLLFAILTPTIATNFPFLGSLTKLFELLGIVGIMFYARLWGETGERRYANYTILIFIVQTWIALVSAYLRMALILPTVVLIVGYLSGTKNIKSLISVRLFPFLLFAGLFLTFFGELGKYRGYSFKDAVVIISESNSDPEEFNEDRIIIEEEEDEGKTSGFLERSSTLAQVTNIFDLVNRKGYYDGLTTSTVLIALVPRFLWPDKPVIRLGAWYAVEIGITVKDAINNSINMTIPGQMYLDFGWIGAIICTFLFGGFMAALWNSSVYNESSTNLLGILLGGYLLIYSFVGISIDLQIAVTFLSVYLMFFAISKILPMIIVQKE